jgi:GGDEF domain-containing protein
VNITLDLYSVQVMTALVVNVSGILFIVETLLRRDEGAGRIWALGFLAAMLTTLAYVIWAQSPEAWWAVAVGNAAFVGGTGCMWLGCRRFNGRAMALPSALVAAAALAAGVAVFVAGPEAGDWAGALWMFVPLLAFAGAGAIECLRGELRESRTAWVLSAVLALQSLYYLSRTTAFLTSGPDSALFQNAFGTITTSLITVTLTIVAVVVTSVLRASRAPMRGHLRPAGFGTARDGILSQDVFRGALGDLCERASWRSELVGVIAVRIDDLEQISTAFGSDVARAVTETWRTGVRTHAPSDAFVAEDGSSGLLVGMLAESPREARRRAAVIYRGLFDDLGTVGTADGAGARSGSAGGVIPVVGVGVALSDAAGYDADALMSVARGAASRAATSVDTSVLVGDAE